MDTETLADKKILVITGDAPYAREVAEMVEREGYSHVMASGEPRETLYQVAQWKPDAILLDLDLPDADPLALVRKLADQDADDGRPPIVGLTSREDEGDLRAYIDGGVDGLVRKPLEPLPLALELRSRLMIHSLLSGSGQRRPAGAAPDRELDRAQIGVLQTLARLVEYRDFKTERHAERVGDLSAKIAQELELADDEVALIRDAAPLHDVGMVVVPDHILLKEGDLTPDERKIMMTHAANGARILSESDLPVMQLASVIAHTHHERWDGQGYPRELEGEDIPLPGRIVAAADTFEAITHDRPFREAESAEEALDEIRNERGRQFDPRVVDALIRVKEREPYPVP